MTASIDLCIDWVRIGECPGATLAAVSRDLTAGEWLLAGDVADVALQGTYTLSDVNTIRAVDGRRIPFAGYVAPLRSGNGGLEVFSDAYGEHFTLGGPDLWAVLAERVTYPTPSTEQPWATSFDERTGVASTVAAAYITANLGSGALAARQYPGVTIVDRTAGLIGSWSGRLQPLDQLIQRICREGAITCRLSVDFTGALTVTLVAARDRTSTTVLSDQGDLVNVRRRRIAASSTFVIAGGQGVLNTRTFRSATSGATGAARKEVFSDQSVLSTGTEVQQSANATLAGAAANWSIHAEIATTAAQTIVQGVDYDLGDTVAVEIDNVRYPVPVSAVTYTITPTSQIISPVLGDAAPNLLGGLISDIADLQSRFDTQIA